MMQFQVVWVLMSFLVSCQDMVQEMCFNFSIWGYGMSLSLQSKVSRPRKISTWRGKQSYMSLEELENSGVNQA